jgi:hypothetical protein
VTTNDETTEPPRALLLAPTHEEARWVIGRWRDALPELAAGEVMTPQSNRAVKDGYRATVVYIAPGLTGGGTYSQRTALRRMLILADRLLLKSQAEQVFHLLAEDPALPTEKLATRDVIALLAPPEPAA